jgi:hypothetical protein
MGGECLVHRAESIADPQWSRPQEFIPDGKGARFNRIVGGSCSDGFGRAHCSVVSAAGDVVEIVWSPLIRSLTRLGVPHA